MWSIIIKNYLSQGIPGATPGFKDEKTDTRATTIYKLNLTVNTHIYIYVYGRELGTKISDTNKLTYRECTGYFKWWVYYRFYKGCLQQIAIKIFSLVYSVWYICTSENYKVTQLLKGLSIYRRIRKQIELAGPTGRPIKWTPIQVWVRSAWPWHSSLT